MVRKSTIVIKLGTFRCMHDRKNHCANAFTRRQGTSSIVHETTHQPLLSTLSSVVETVIRLKEDGHKVVLVSSGAIGVGLKRMELDTRPTNLSQKQVCC
jgi:glutamate 5-kinase